MHTLPEPWNSAEHYLHTHGPRAEAEVKRLARTLGACGHDGEVEKLFRVYQAIRSLRESAAVRH